MRKLVLIMLTLAACTTSKDRAKEYLNARGMSADSCMREQGHYSDITFCVVDRMLLICTDWCMEVPLDAPKP